MTFGSFANLSFQQSELSVVYDSSLKIVVIKLPLLH
jgi:hypothetical protein